MSSDQRGVASTPQPPYYAVIFTSLRRDDDGEAYGRTAERMMELAAKQPGFLGVESAREGLGITVSYWTDLDAIAAWKRNAEHLTAQGNGRRDPHDNRAGGLPLLESQFHRPAGGNGVRQFLRGQGNGRPCHQEPVGVTLEVDE